jgi:NAD(P)-dependent dehydrogenase (short-subunit alcohol dehydrogenase family)
MVTVTPLGVRVPRCEAAPTVVHVQHVQHVQHGHAGRKAADRSRRARQRPLPGWAAEWGQYGIRVNAVAPGNVSSDNVVDFIGADRFTTWSGVNPLKRNATPEELAEVITFVASERAGFVTGQVFVADGGRLAV